MPLHITKIKTYNDNDKYYYITYNNVFTSISNYDDIKCYCDNYDEVSPSLEIHIREIKINKILNKRFSIQKNKVLYKNNKYQ